MPSRQNGRRQNVGRQIICPRCGATNLGEQDWCLRCRASLPAAGASAGGRACARCGATIRPGATFCGQCGARQAEAPPDRWMLSVRTGPQAGQAFELGERTRVGRSDDNEICLQGAKLSRHHALIERTPQRMRITDLGSTNGTWVNGRRITGTVPVEAGASISIGDVQCTLLADG